MSTVTNGPATEFPRSTIPAPEYRAEKPSYSGTGWVVFAAIMFALSAALNIIWGIAAVSSSHFFVAGASYILSDLNTWGWVAIGFGALETLAALSIWRGGSFGRWFGIAVAGFGLVAAMLSIPAYPLWSLTLVAIYVFVIYGLAAYGGKSSVDR
ncbi:MAG TPA: hypothetical protein VH834_21070 [Solirubrobacteraceae bacterium]|jgi:hypothetical protein